MADDDGGGGDMNARRVRRKMVGMADNNIWSLNEDIVDKLRVLSYEREFCRVKSHKPLSRTFFALPGRQEEQFPYFASLCAWLLREVSQDFIEWSEFEDPNTINDSIVHEVKRLGFEGDIPQNELRSGHGDGVVLVLSFIIDKVLQARHWRPSAPVYIDVPGDAEEAIVDQEAELHDDQIEEDFVGGNDDDDHNYFGGMGGGDDGIRVDGSSRVPGDDGTDGIDHHVVQGVMEAKVDPAEWRLEVERVGPLLKFKPRAHAAKEWRAHLEQSVKHAAALKEHYPATQTALAKLASKMNALTEQISSKERQINKEFDHLGGDCRVKQQALNATQQRYNDISKAVAELTEELAQKTDAVELVKSQMDEKNNSMVDTSPLRRITASLASLRQEVQAMELRIGVVNQTLLQSKLKHSKAARVHGRHVGGMHVSHHGGSSGGSGHRHHHHHSSSKSRVY